MVSEEKPVLGSIKPPVSVSAIRLQKNEAERTVFTAEKMKKKRGERINWSRMRTEA